MKNISANSQNLVLWNLTSNESQNPTKKTQEENVLLKAHMSLFKDKVIFVHQNKERGLFASICILKGSDANHSENLPLVGVSKELLKVKDPCILERFFEHTHLIPEKSMDGTYNRVQVHVSGKGGMKQKIPFQPGLALGSVVRGDIIDKMEKYSETLSKMESVEQQVRDLEQGAKTLSGKLHSIKQKRERSPVDQEMKRLFESQLEMIKERIGKMPEQLQAITELELPFFSNMTTGLETPIDFDMTQVATDSRGFDSINYNSQYIDMNESEQRTKDKMDQSSSASSANVSGSRFGVKVSASHSWASGAMNRVADIKSQGHASKILLINALVTTRHVRYLKNRQYHVDKLRTILAIMERGGDPEELKKQGITQNQAGENCVYMLSEAVMGGSFSAIVSYLKEDASSRAVRDSARHSSSSTSVQASYSGFGVSAAGGYSDSRQRANEDHDDHLKNQGNLNIAIEFIAQGAIPQLARDTVMREALKHQDQNLRKYHSSGSEGKDKSVYARQGELQKAMHDTVNTVQQTKVEKEELSVHSPNSVLKAYDDFCGEIVSDSECGVPVGFNYSVLTKGDIRRILDGARAEEQQRDDV